MKWEANEATVFKVRAVHAATLANVPAQYELIVVTSALDRTVHEKIEKCRQQYTVPVKGKPIFF